MLLRRTKNKKGVTLMELLAVFVIMGIITAISIPTYNYLFKEGEYEALQAQEREVNKLMESSILAKKGVPLKASTTRGITTNGIYSMEFVISKCPLVTNLPPCELDLGMYKKDKKLNTDIEGTFFVFPRHQDPDKPIPWGEAVPTDNQRNYGLSVSRGFPVEHIQLLSIAYKNSKGAYPLKSGSKAVDINLLINNKTAVYPHLTTDKAFGTTAVEFEYTLTGGNQIERKQIDE